MIRGIIVLLLSISCISVLMSCSQSYRDSYEGVTPEELANLSTPIYTGDMSLISEELDEWKENSTPEELVEKILIASKTSNKKMQSVLRVFIIGAMLPTNKEEIPEYMEYSKILYSYYPDQMPQWLVDLLSKDFEARIELRKQLGVEKAEKNAADSETQD